MLQDICPILSQPYVVHLLRHIYDPNVSDCVLALIYRYVGTEPRELRQERFYQLAGMEFMDRLFGMLDEKLVNVPSESLSGIRLILWINYVLKLCASPLGLNCQDCSRERVNARRPYSLYQFHGIAAACFIGIYRQSYSRPKIGTRRASYNGDCQVRC